MMDIMMEPIGCGPVVGCGPCAVGRFSFLLAMFLSQLPMSILGFTTGVGRQARGK